MDKKRSELLDELIKGLKDGNEFHELQDQLLKRGVETLLKAEMDAHLGYEKGGEPPSNNRRNGSSEKTLRTASGPQRIKVPRDREGSFDPVTVPKNKTMTEQLGDCVKLLYAKGMSNADIMDFMTATYGVKYSTTQISLITDALLKDMREWQDRPLQNRYAVVWIDAIHYKVRLDGRVVSKACMVVLGIDMEGRQDILALRIMETESAAGWATLLDELGSRGVEDILFLCSDNLKGLDKAVEATFPEAVRQVCIVHQVRTSLKFVGYKDRKAVVADIKRIYRATNEETARDALVEFSNKWAGKYDRAIKSWEDNWENLVAFLNYPAVIRKLIYTTNIIESFNSCLRKHTRNKKVFPTDDAALKSVYLAAMQIERKWKKKRSNWAQIHNQLFIFFKDRIV